MTVYVVMYNATGGPHYEIDTIFANETDAEALADYIKAEGCSALVVDYEVEA